MTDHSDNESVTDSAVTSKVGIGEVSTEKRGSVAEEQKSSEKLHETRRASDNLHPELIESGETGRSLLSLSESTRGLVTARRSSGRT